MDLSQLTLTQRKMITLLSDFRPHTVKELHTCLHDELSNLEVIRGHLSLSRKVLRRGGIDILCQRGPNGFASSSYQMVRLTASPYSSE